MKAIKINIYQPEAVYRIPLAQRRILTYPIPPYSTVFGFLVNICGFKDNPDYIDKLKDTCVAIYGSFKYKTTEYIWYRSLVKERHVKRFGAPENRKLDGLVEHPGGQMPVYVDVLNHVKLTIYLHSEDTVFQEDIKSRLENPSHWHDTPHLGRAGDSVVIEGVEEVELEKKHIRGWFHITQHDFFWIPRVYLKKNLGLFYRLTSLYEKHNGVRVFNHIEVCLGERNLKIHKSVLNRDIYVDTTADIPVFFIKFNGGI